MSLCQYVVAICSHPSSSLATFIVLTYPQQDEIFCSLLILAAPPLDTRPCISRFALGPGFVLQSCDVDTTLMLFAAATVCSRTQPWQ